MCQLLHKNFYVDTVMNRIRSSLKYIKVGFIITFYWEGNWGSEAFRSFHCKRLDTQEYK